jgi:hypothetical protein
MLSSVCGLGGRCEILSRKGITFHRPGTGRGEPGVARFARRDLPNHAPSTTQRFGHYRPCSPPRHSILSSTTSAVVGRFGGMLVPAATKRPAAAKIMTKPATASTAPAT